MKLNTALGIAAAVLGATFAGQVAVSYFFGKPGPTHFVSWQHYPKSAQEATALAKRIVEARVVNVRRGPDLVLQAPGEPGGADRIPQEVATLQVETDIKGTGPNQIEVSQTAAFIGSPIGRPAPTGPAPPKPVAPDGRTGRDRPAQVPEATYPAAARHLLESAPPYQAGQRYVLFLTDGPTLGGKSTHTVISPEGRYHIGSGGALQPVTNRPSADADFGLNLRGKNLTNLRGKLQQIPGIQVRPVK
ncbi:MAG: hypothetical protein AABZ64_11855 [Nitrospinota bacterium]